MCGCSVYRDEEEAYETDPDDAATGIILFCVMVIPTTVLTSYSGSKFLANSEEMIAETSLAGLIANRHLFENSIANLASDAVRLSSSTIFNQIRFMETYDDINANYNNVNYGLSLLKELVNLNHRVDGVYSPFSINSARIM